MVRDLNGASQINGGARSSWSIFKHTSSVRMEVDVVTAAVR